MLADKAR